MTRRVELAASFWIWDLYYAAGFLITTGLVLFGFPDLTLVERLGTGSAIAATGVWYVLFGRRLIVTEEQGLRAMVFVTGVVLLFGVGVAFQPRMTIGWFAAFPLVFMSAPLRVALPAVGVISLLPPAMVVLHEGMGSDYLPVALMVSLIGGLFSALLGVWIVRMSEESEERARLIEQLEASKAEVARLSHEAGTSAERARLAREIHDTLAQGFTSIVTLVQAVESKLDTDLPAARKHLELAASTARENLTEARTLVAALTPSVLDTGSLADAVRRRAQRLGDEAEVDVTVRAVELPPLPTAAEVVLLRAAQEALTNVGKHASAATVRVDLTPTDGGVRLTVADDGAGFDPDAGTTGFGLRGMRERAAQVGGTLTVRSEPGAGTTVRVEVPR